MSVATITAAPPLLSAKRVGWAGVALGVLAFFIAVPPIMVRSVIPVIVLGVFAFAAGAFALR
jgi:simple sugar transport system permease protein